MSKLKNIVKQLSNVDFQAVYDLLINSNAEKSAYLLKFLREKQYSDSRIMEELEVNSNAYYTLRSRLNQKIEDYLLAQMESPRTTLIKKVATIHEIIFTKKKTIAIATLKKLEKELIEYDLSNELTIVYKTLKKLSIYNPEDYYAYNQAYNRHVAYMLAVDKAESYLGEYFKKYSEFYLSNDETDLFSLEIIKSEMESVSNLYKSHRLYIYSKFLQIFHSLKIEKKASPEIASDFDKIQNIFDSYYQDVNYYHLILVLEYLKLEYYSFIKDKDTFNKSFDGLNENTATFIENYNLFTFSIGLLLINLNHWTSGNNEKLIFIQMETAFSEYEINKNNIAEYVIYYSYCALGHYYNNKPNESVKLINKLINDTTIKKYSLLNMELKLYAAFQYVILEDYEKVNQVLNSVYRQVRINGLSDDHYLSMLLKALKTANQSKENQKLTALQLVLDKIKNTEHKTFCIFKYVNIK